MIRSDNGKTWCPLRPWPLRRGRIHRSRNWFYHRRCLSSVFSAPVFPFFRRISFFHVARKFNPSHVRWSDRSQADWWTLSFTGHENSVAGNRLDFPLPAREENGGRARFHAHGVNAISVDNRLGNWSFQRTITPRLHTSLSQAVANVTAYSRYDESIICTSIIYSQEEDSTRGISSISSPLVHQSIQLRFRNSIFLRSIMKPIH